MKAIKKQKKLKKLVVIAPIVALVVISLAAYGLFQTQQSIDENDDDAETSKINYDPPTENEKAETDANKADIVKHEADRNNNTQSGSINITISRASQAEPGSDVNIRTVITGASSGVCEVTFTKDSQPAITKTFPVAPESSYAVCANADINISEFSESGTWTLRVMVKDGARSSNTDDHSVEVTR